MFTGLTEATAKVRETSGGSLAIERPRSFADLKIGSSILVSGVCLSIVKLTKASMAFETVPTTRRKSTLGQLHVGDRVNLERAMKLGDRFEGHIVLGHCEGVGEVESIEAPTPRPSPDGGGEGGKELTIALPRALVPFIRPHGSIALDGVSLTVAEVKGNRCSVALIPHTLQSTTLGSLKKGDDVNIETDILGKYLHSVRLTARR